MLLDACHSGGAGTPKRIGPMEVGLGAADLAPLARGKGRIVIASCDQTEESFVLPGAANSLFTSELLAGLGGEAARADGTVGALDLFIHVSTAVPRKAEQHPILKVSDANRNVVIAAGAPRPVARIDQTLGADVSTLRKKIVATFSLEEVSTLVSDVRVLLEKDGRKVDPISLDYFGGTNLAARVHNLIGYLDRRGYLDYLIRAIRAEREGLV